MRGLYLITPDCDDDGRLAEMVAAALLARPAVLQYRSKLPDRARRRRQALRLKALCEPAAVPLLINDDLTLAAEVDADGVHLGRDDASPAEARARFPGLRWVGASCYDDPERAVAAVAAGANMVAFGACFPSATKPAAVHADLSCFAIARRQLPVDVLTVAIGGITRNNAAQVLAAGADLVAVISDVFAAPDIAARALAWQKLC